MSEEKPRAKPQEKLDDTGSNPVNVVRSQQNFIFRNFSKMPRAVQVLVYMMFTLLVIYSTLRLVDGEFAVRGQILVRGDQVWNPASGYEIGIGEQTFGTNSKGFYHLILGPLQYYTLVASGDLKLNLNKGGSLVEEDRSVKFHRVSQLLDPIKLDLTAHAELPRAPSPVAAAPWVAMAAARPGEARLVVYLLQAPKDLGQVSGAMLALESGGNSLGLLSTRGQGGPAGSLPVLAGEAVRYGGDYYFALDNPRQAAGAKIELSVAGGIFSKIAQVVSGSSGGDVFLLPANFPEGQILTVKGQQGGQIQLVLARRFDVVVFSKGDSVEQSKDTFKSKLLERGFYVREQRAPLGYGQTNGLFAGSSVPFTAIQQVVRAASDAGVALKTVQYKVQLKSGNQLEMQVGQSAKCDDSPAIEPETLQKLVSAGSEADFAKLVGPLQSCKPIPIQQRVQTKR